jgi:hypothetical protein
MNAILGNNLDAMDAENNISITSLNKYIDGVNSTVNIDKGFESADSSDDELDLSCLSDAEDETVDVSPTTSMSLLNALHDPLNIIDEISDRAA